MCLGSCIAVVVVQAGSCSLDWTPSLGPSICRGCGPKKTKDKDKKKKKDRQERFSGFFFPPFIQSQGWDRQVNSPCPWSKGSCWVTYWQYCLCKFLALCRGLGLHTHIPGLGPVLSLLPPTKYSPSIHHIASGGYFCDAKQREQKIIPF